MSEASRSRTIATPLFLARLLASGGDARIAVPPASNVNLYGASPFPREILGYAASTANEISPQAFAHLGELTAQWPAGSLPGHRWYEKRLEALRGRLRTSFGLPADIDVVFAPSGTDLEYVALAVATSRGDKPVRNILLGKDEVGSGCVLAAGGRFFASETAVRTVVVRGSPLPGLERTEVVTVRLRNEAGQPRKSAAIGVELDALCYQGISRGQHIVVHVVHGSKSGLVLPRRAEIEALRRRHGVALTVVVDACQARITGADVRSYLRSDAIVLLTGSKFMGGPPFSGMALVPPALRPPGPLCTGLAQVFRRGEFPLSWVGRDGLTGAANPGLLLRLEAALFELERFDAVAKSDRDRVIAAFGQAVRALVTRLGVSLVGPSLKGSALCESALATLDLSALQGHPDLAKAQLWWRILAARGMRLGQPVKCVSRDDGSWAGTLRISLSMPLIADCARLDDASLTVMFSDHMHRIASVLEAAQRPVAI